MSEAFAALGDQKAGDLRFILRDHHLNRLHHEIGDLIIFITLAPVITAALLENFRFPLLFRRGIHIVSHVAGVADSLFAVGIAGSRPP